MSRQNTRRRDMQDQAWGGIRVASNPPADFDAAHIGQVYVEQSQHRALLFHDLDRFRAGARLLNRKPQPLEHSRARISPGNIIVNVQDEWRRHGQLALLSAGAVGSGAFSIRLTVSAISDLSRSFLATIPTAFERSRCRSAPVRVDDVTIITGISFEPSAALSL